MECCYSYLKQGYPSHLIAGLWVTLQLPEELNGLHKVLKCLDKGLVKHTIVPQPSCPPTTHTHKGCSSNEAL